MWGRITSGLIVVICIWGTTETQGKVQSENPSMADQPPATRNASDGVSQEHSPRPRSGDAQPSPAAREAARPSHVGRGVSVPSPLSKGGNRGVEQHTESNAVLIDHIPADQLRPVPRNARVITHYASGRRQAPDEPSARDIEYILYSNTLGASFYPPGNMIRIADDIYTHAADDFELAAYLVRVCGGVEDGDGQFDVIVSLFEQCPSTLPWDAPAIPGTEMKYTGLLDNLEDIHELVIDYRHPNIGICDDNRACRIYAQDCIDGSACVDGPPVIAPPSLWLRVEFSTDEAGWIVDAPAIRGFSADRYSHIFAGCDTWFGGYPLHPHASFYAEIFGTNVGRTHQIAYLAANPDGSVFDAAPGTSFLRLADDIQLFENWCELSAIEIATKGTAGSYEIDFDLRKHLVDGPIPGTQRTFTSREDGGQGELETARFTFDPGINLPRDSWLTWQANKPHTGLINAGRALIGSSRPIYAAYDHPDNPGEWAEYTTLDGSPAIFGVAVFCRSQIPSGACCPDQPDEGGQDPVCVDGVTVLECVGQRWLNDGTCPEGHNDPNDPWLLRGFPACGTHACCKPDNTCENLRRDECAATVDAEGKPSKWFPGEFCDTDGFACPHLACFHAEHNCLVGLDWDETCEDDLDCEYFGPSSFCQFPERVCWVSGGCNDIDCCNWVCSDPMNQFCCDIVWDLECAAMAANCPLPPAQIIASNPPDQRSLWRSQHNIARFTFDADITTPTAGQVEIREILPGGYCGPDLSASFTFDVESGTVLRIRDTGATLEHRKWYAFRNVGNWPGVEPFEIQYVVQMGDCDGNTLVISLDAGCVNAGIPCFVNCGDDNRKDIDGDGRVISLDVGVVNAHIGSFAVLKPTGHGDGGGCLELARVLDTDPPDYGTFWRTHNNTLRITFDADITAPRAGEVEIYQLHRCGWVVGDDLSPSFTFDVEDDANGNPRVLKIQENGSVLKHCAKHSFRNVGNWRGVADFELHRRLAIGDADGNGIVISLDVAAVNAGIPCFENCGEDNRLDIDGDGRVTSLDVGHVNAHIGCFPTGPPCPHDNENPD